MSWFDSLAPAEVAVPCGTGTHTVRWEAGRLTLPAHPDAEAELVLGALGGDKPRCVTLADTWARHTDDLGVLTAGPRSAADRVSVDWAEVEELRAQLGRHVTPVKVARTLRYSTGASRPGGSQAAPPSRGGPTLPLGVQPVQALAVGLDMDDLLRRQLRQIELLELVALGAEFQFRLAGTVTAAWAGPERAQDRASRGPELSGVLTGRFALAARDWAGIDPDAVTVSPHEGPGWGSVEVVGTGRGRRLRASLPLGWLAGVWACGLAVVDGYLVVAVERAGYPGARVLGLATPGSEPVPLEAHATGGSTGGLTTWAL